MEASMSHAGYLLLLLAPVSLLVTLLAHAAVFVVLKPRKREREHAPAITVLKPVKGVEEGLYENLASFARQDYPDFELLIGADDPRDPALAVARKVKADHPATRIHILTGARNLGLNPKVNRHLRWAQMRRRLSLTAFLGELLLNPVLLIVAAALAVHDVRLLALGALGIAVKCAADALVLRRLGPAPRLAQLLAVPLKDLLIAAIWAVGAFRRTVNWRGNLMRIERGNLLVPLEKLEPGQELVREAA
jgi:glycosyltransferase involved in cell wall biosynthesis